MKFHKGIIKIENIEEVCERLQNEIKTHIFTTLRRKGGVIGISGGIDSSVSLALTTRAIGADKILGVLLPEKDSSPESARLAHLLADKFGVKTLTEDITGALEGFGCYRRRDEAVARVFPNYDPKTYKMKIGVRQSGLNTGLPPVFHLTIVDPKGKEESKILPVNEYAQIVASSNFKQRSRMSMLYYHAERLHYAVVGTPNKHEVEQGFFVKHGDGGADLMPIGKFYKTQVYQIAEYLGVPKEIIERTPTTDTYTAEQTQEEFFYQMPFHQMDVLWYAFENEVPASEVAPEMGMTEDAVKKIFTNFERKKQTTDYLRRGPIHFQEIMDITTNAFDYFFENTKNSDSNFLLGNKEQVSFANLHQNSVRLANYLHQELGTGENIILISHNNLFFITAYLGILKSGNVVIPLNPGVEESTLKFIVEQCNAKVAFISTGTPVKVSGLEIINESNVDSLTSTKPEVSEIKTLDKESPAEIIFTSGSTGVPKGVVISHKNLIANTSSIIEYLNLSGQDTMLVVLPFYYCYGLSLLHTHLRVGGSIVLNNAFIFTGGILRDLNHYQCTGFAGVPSHFQILLRKTKSFVTNTFPHLRYVTQAGGKLPTVFIQEFVKAFPTKKFFVMYGQTEATARLSYLPPECLPNKLGSIGKGIPRVTLRVVNEKGEDIKPGENGEIIAKGENIMSGYYKDPELTSTTLRDGWLYTGDIATVDEDGFIFVVSRKKEIIKVGGKRVSPKEIEEVILMLPEVIDCTVVGVEDPLLGESIKASIVLNDESKNSITVDTILNHCHANLSKHKVPSQIEFESSLKMSATGKKVKSLS